MNKIIYTLILISLISTVQADRWSQSDYEYFCAEYSKQIFGWNFQDYYNTSETNATNCVHYPVKGYPEDFWVGVPDDYADRDQCTFRSNCPARIWAREWFDMAFDQNNTEDQVCGMCNAIYYAVRSFNPYLKDDADRDDIMQLLHDFQWLAMETTPSGYCVEGHCGMSCMKAIDVSVEKAIVRNDKKWQEIFDAGGIKVVEQPAGADSCPACPPLTCPECECRVCPEPEVCKECEACEYTKADLDEKDNTINDLNEALIECQPSEEASADEPDGETSYTIYIVGLIVVVVVILGLAFIFDRY